MGLVAVRHRLLLALLLAFSLGLIAGRASAVRMPVPQLETAMPTAGPIPRLARWPVEPVERPSPPTPPAAVEPTGARSEPSLPARSGHTAKGWATWHATGRDGMFAAAGPRLRSALGPGWRGNSVQVCAAICIRVTLNDWCRCSESRIIDLSDEAFTQLAPLGRGVIQTVVSW